MEDQEEEIDERWEELREDLTYAMFHRDVPHIQSLLSLVSEVGCEDYLEAEVSSARLLLSRMEKERDASLQELQKVLTRESINEIRSMLHPPVLIKDLLRATLLLLGHSEEHTEDWKYVVKVLGKFGHEHLLNVMLDVKIRDIPVDVALRARDIVKDINEEKVKTVDCASVALYKWITGLVDEVVVDAETGVSKIEPHKELHIKPLETTKTC